MKDINIIGLDEEKTLIYHKIMNLRYISKSGYQKMIEKDPVKKLNDLKAFTKKEFFVLSKKNLSVPIYLMTL